ncbi:MAG: gephyrin-like molybdotransferase receptor GlpR [Mycobacterium sp.]
MPSIPQSLLWISLVVLWLFVLVPMLVSKRDAVRRTSDVALATRVLNSDATGRLIKRVGVSAGHRSDPDWRPEEDEYDDLDDADDEDEDADDAPTSRVVATVAAEATAEEMVPDYLDVDVIDPDSPALPAGEAEAEQETDTTLAVEVDDEDTFDDDDADQYEYVDDTSGLPVAADEPLTGAMPAFSRRHLRDAGTAAAVKARKYAFRRRVLTIMALSLVVTAAMAYLLTSSAWWLFSVTAVATVLYLGYLRRQTRIEERVQRRRMQRMARSHLGVENTHDREYDVVPSRLRRPGAVVLEIDDEDPIFEHLEYAPYAREYSWHRDLPRAAGQ